jgi:uncharacterized membrane protein
MSAPHKIVDPSERFDPARLIAISDGIFAVALTLLIINVKPPEGDARFIVHALLSIAPSLGIFALSFWIVAYYWVVHHLMFTYVRAANRGLLWTNLLFLLTIVVLPFSAAVLGRYPLAPAALMVYGANLVCCTATLALAWWYAARTGLLADVPPAQARYIRLRFVLSQVLALLGVALAPFVPVVSLVLFIAVPLFHALTSRPATHARAAPARAK